jgi:hypothetical protein
MTYDELIKGMPVSVNKASVEILAKHLGDSKFTEVQVEVNESG